jgi:glycosyltransferase involved in cell wall biosynthesis
VGSPQRSPAVSVALPVYHEEGILEQLHALLTKACREVDDDYEVLYVDDGSRDRTAEILAKLAVDDPHVTVVTHSRNFGHPAGLAAAVELAAGASLVLMDADMQDDPAAIPKLVEKAVAEQAEVVYAVRRRRKEGPVMSLLFGAFHRLLSRTASFTVPPDAGSFGLLGPRALAQVRRMTERLRYFPGLRAFVGFKQVALEVERGERYDRSSRVGLRGLVRLAGLAFFSQSRVPVSVLYVLSGSSLLAALALLLYAVVSKAIGIALPSWASTITAITFFSATIILGQALIAEYLARIYEEVRGRPPYIVREIRGAMAAGEERHGATDAD